jgi:hypothetical protein
MEPFFAEGMDAIFEKYSVCADFADPKMRDAALSAVGQLAPSGRRGVSSVAIGGRAMPDRPWRTLTPQTRLQVRACSKSRC